MTDRDCTKILSKMDGQICSEIKVPQSVEIPSSMKFKGGNCMNTIGSRNIEMLSKSSPRHLTELCGDSNCCTEIKYKKCPDRQIVINGSCQCPDNSIWDGKICNECPNTQIVINGKCQCPTGRSWNYVKRECVPSCTCSHFLSTGECFVYGVDGHKDMYPFSKSICNTRLSDKECTKDNTKSYSLCEWSPQPPPPPPPCKPGYRRNTQTGECYYCPHCY